jgi:hypothetical protein
MYTFKITNEHGECTEYQHIIKVCYFTTDASLGSKENIIEGDEIFNHKYKTSYDLYLYSDKDAFTISKKCISIIQVIKED